MIQVTDPFDLSADDDNDDEPSHFIAAQQQRDAAKKIPGPTGTLPATRVLKRLWEDKKDTGDAQGLVKKVTMDHSVVIWVAGCSVCFSSFYRGSWKIPSTLW
ncbi:unnamed protein product [Musa hybrid cultivar]